MLLTGLTGSTGYQVAVRSVRRSDLVEALPVGRVGVRERHPAQNILIHTSAAHFSKAFADEEESWWMVREHTGKLLMFRSSDWRVLITSEFWGDVKKRITSCLLWSTARSCVGLRNHSLISGRGSLIGKGVCLTTVLTADTDVKKKIIFSINNKTRAWCFYVKWWNSYRSSLEPNLHLHLFKMPEKKRKHVSIDYD